jgi:hypothetical protein
MSLFESISKSGWEHSNPEVRMAAIDKLEDPAVLLELVMNDPESDVRSRALARITEAGQLDDLADSLTGELQAQARKQRLDQLLPDITALPLVSDESQLLRIASLADDPELIRGAIGRIHNPDVLMDTAVSHLVARVRLCAAQGITDSAQLQELMGRVKHKDKSVYRHCKDLLDERHASERAEAELQDRISQLAEDAAKLASGADTPEYTARYQTLQHRWEELRQHSSKKQCAGIDDNLEICLGRIDALNRIQAADQKQQELSDEARNTFREIIEKLEATDPLGTIAEDSEGIRALHDSINHMEERWVSATHHAQPSSGQFKACKKHLKLWRQVAQTLERMRERQTTLDEIREESGHLDASDFLLLQKLEKKAAKLSSKLAWPETLATQTPEPIRQLHEQQARLQELMASLKGKQKKNLQLIESAFEELLRELDENHFKNADRSLNRIRTFVRRLPPQQQKHFQNELKPLVARLHEIHDWQGFAIEPKKIELCERMQALIGVDEGPDSLAGKIKALQEEWKKLGPLSPRRDQALWKQFRAAANEAYKPCKKAFAEQAVQRQQNFEQRMELVAQLTDYETRMAWPDAPDNDAAAGTPDWRMVQKTLDTAREAFRNIKPVDRKGERKSRKALKSVCDRIYGHIKEEYDRNIAAKKDLVSRARALDELEDLKEAINQAKEVQREWKQVGVTPRQVDRRLWKEFRGACDAVFARLDNQREERKAVANERAEQARARALEKQQSWRHLQEKMQACALKAADEEAAAELWQNKGAIPGGIDAAALEAWWQEGSGQESNEEEVREFCIAMEILHDMESPADDKEARMAYQMKRLVEGMGAQQADKKGQLLNLINQFIALRPAAEWVERFCSDGKINPPR